MRTLHVFIDQRLIGTLSEGDDLWAFDYDAEWAEHQSSFDLSPALSRAQLRHADGGTYRPVQWYFDNLLPEELLREAVAKEAQIKGDDAFALLTYLGAESAGSLTLVPTDVSPHLCSGGQLRPLTDEDLSGRINHLPRQTLAKAAPKRMSLAGAQHKLLVVLQGDRLYEPEGATPSTHILKPDHPDGDVYPASTFNEYLMMRLARAARLQVPSVFLRYVPEPVYVIERFDRLVAQPKKVQRLHIIDACQLLNKPRGFKHTGATLESLVDITSRTVNKIDTRQRLFRWLVFNVLIANDDCHLKNLSFYVRPEGVTLAPHYDLLATGAYYTKAFADERASWAQVPMAFPLPSATYFGDVTLAHVLDAAAVLGVPRSTAQRVVAEVVSQVEGAFRNFVSEHTLNVEAASTNNPTAALALLHGLQSRLLCVFEHITLRDMSARLRPPANPKSKP